MADKVARSKTMRIDLIRDVRSRPQGLARREVVISSIEGGEDMDRAREARETSRYDRLLQSVYDAALITDVSGNIRDANVRAVEFFRCDRERLCGLSLADVVSGADDALVGTLLENLENERFTLIQAYCVRRDGSFFPAEIAVNKLLLDEEHLCFFMRDITLRRQAEEMLLTEHNAIQNSGNCIAVADLAAGLEYVNPATARMWGFATQDEMLGMDVRDLLSEPEASSEMLRVAVLEEQSWSGTARARRRDGTEFHAQVSAAPNRNSFGEPVGIVLSFVDISDRIRAGNVTREAERQRVMLESLGAACHHLRQPATVLMANLGMIRDQVRSDGSQADELLDASIKAAEDLSRILHKLNTVNEYKTTSYLDEQATAGRKESRILEI